MKERSKSTKNVVFTAMAVAIIIIFSQIAIPSPWGIPFTLQTLAVAFSAYFLGIIFSLVAISVYLVGGLIGLPIFSGFSSGVAVFSSGLGGFLLGFIPLVLLCAVGQKTGRNWLAFLLGIVGVIVCHLIGAINYSLVYKTPYFISLLTCSLPFILKDFGSVILAKVLDDKIKILVQKKNR